MERQAARDVNSNITDRDQSQMAMTNVKRMVAAAQSVHVHSPHNRPARVNSDSQGSVSSRYQNGVHWDTPWERLHISTIVVPYASSIT